MKEESNLGRRGFLKSVGAAGTAALAGCAGVDYQKPAETTTEDHTTESTEAPTTEENKELSNEEIKSLLEETAYELHDELYMRGFEGDSFKMVDVSTSLGDDTEYNLRVGIDIESLFHMSGEKGRRPDLHTASELDLGYEVMDDISTELYELTGMINDNLDSFYEEAGSPEEVPLDVNINIAGDRGSSYHFDINTAEEHLDPTMTKFIKAPNTTGGHGYKPGEYENLKLLGEEEVMSIKVEDVEGEHDAEHTIEYIEDGVFELNGTVQEREEGEKLGRFSGEDVYVHDIDPIYLQEEREDIEGAVELQFDEGSPNY